jgi:hypothetical protein
VGKACESQSTCDSNENLQAGRPTMDTAVLNLPFAIQVSLGSGYAAYLLAFSGLRQHHTATDVIFRTIAFGLVATLSIELCQKAGISEVVSAIVAFALAVISGALWRAAIGPLFRQFSRKYLFAWSDDLPSAWLSVTAERTDLRPSQIVVELSDGRLLMCDDTRVYQRAPFECGVFGLDGSIAMYVTSEKPPSGDWFNHEAVLHQHEGANITFIPADNIRRVEIRQWKKPSSGRLPRRLRRGRLWLRRSWRRWRRRSGRSG